MRSTSRTALILAVAGVFLTFLSRPSSAQEGEGVIGTKTGRATHPAPFHPAAGPLQGCWELVPDKGKESGPRVLIRFDGDRLVTLTEGRLFVHRINYESGRLCFFARGRRIHQDFSLEKGILEISFPDLGMPQSKPGPRRFRRLEGIPSEILVKPLPLGEKRKIPEAEVVRIRRELDERLRGDQELRQKMMQKMSLTPGAVPMAPPRPDPAMLMEIKKKSEEDTRFLLETLGKWGWIDGDRFGAAATRSAFMLVQHSGHLRLMLAVRPEIDRLMKAGELDPQMYANFTDRLLVMQGERQLYGTQMGMNEKGDLVVEPLARPGKVDELRQGIGLPALTRHLQMIEMFTGKNAVILKEEPQAAGAKTVEGKEEAK